MPSAGVPGKRARGRERRGLAESPRQEFTWVSTSLLPTDDCRVADDVATVAAIGRRQEAGMSR